jgi:hypothetical protein
MFVRGLYERYIPSGEESHSLEQTYNDEFAFPALFDWHRILT